MKKHSAVCFVVLGCWSAASWSNGETRPLLPSTVAAHCGGALSVMLDAGEASLARADKIRMQRIAVKELLFREKGRPFQNPGDKTFLEEFAAGKIAPENDPRVKLYHDLLDEIECNSPAIPRFEVEKEYLALCKTEVQLSARPASPTLSTLFADQTKAKPAGNPGLPQAVKKWLPMVFGTKKIEFATAADFAHKLSTISGPERLKVLEKSVEAFPPISTLEALRVVDALPTGSRSAAANMLKGKIYDDLNLALYSPHEIMDMMVYYKSNPLLNVSNEHLSELLKTVDPTDELHLEALFTQITARKGKEEALKELSQLGERAHGGLDPETHERLTYVIGHSPGGIGESIYHVFENFLGGEGAAILSKAKPESFQFREIPAGEYEIGSPSGEAGRDSDEPLRKVILTKTVQMQSTHMTQLLESIVWKKNTSHFVEGGEEWKIGDKVMKGFPNRPSESKSWNEMMELIGEFNKILKPYGKRVRLPTEAELEVAMRGGTSTAYPHGDDPHGLHTTAWHNGNSGGQTHDVAEMPPNARGFYDLTGNVSDATGDWYATDVPKVATDPRGPLSGSDRVLLGGSWSSRPADLRSRLNWNPGDRLSNIGFRLVMDDL